MDDVVGQTTYQPGAGVGVCWGVLSNPKTSMKPECSQTFFRNMEDSFWLVCPLIGSPSQSRAAMSIRTAMSKMNISFIEYFGSSRAAFAIDCRFQAVRRMPSVWNDAQLRAGNFGSRGRGGRGETRWPMEQTKNPQQRVPAWHQKCPLGGRHDYVSFGTYKYFAVFGRKLSFRISWRLHFPFSTVNHAGA